MIMIHVKLKIHRVGDPPTHPEHAMSEALSLDEMVVVERGMVSGKTSIMLLLSQHGRYFHAETSLDMLRTLTAGANGADERFKECST